VVISPDGFFMKTQDLENKGRKKNICLASIASGVAATPV
jgi:hypothetical protein